MHGVDVRIADTAVALVGGETLHPQRCELGGHGNAAERHARRDRIRTDPRTVHLIATAILPLLPIGGNPDEH